jgi:hypothetical protein
MSNTRPISWNSLEKKIKWCLPHYEFQNVYPNLGKFAMRSHGYLVMMGDGKLFGWAFCQVHFMCFLGPFLPNHQLHVGQLSSPHCLVHFMCFLGALLPNHQVHLGQLSSPHCQVGAPTPSWQVHFTLSTAPMSFKLPAHFFKFLGCQRPEYFFVC